MEATTFCGPPAADERGIGPLTLSGLLDTVTTAHAGRPALVGYAEGGGPPVRWTYAELRAEVDALSGALVAAGAQRGTRVALLMGNRPEWVAWAFAVATVGGVVVPVNTLFEAPEIAWVLRHADVALVVHQRTLGHHDYAAQLAAAAPDLPFLAGALCLGTDDYAAFVADGAGAQAAVRRRAAEVSPFDDAVVTYTSGSTGRPKGSLHAHRPPALQSWRFAQQLRLGPDVRVWSAFPFFWTAGFCMVMGATLAAGGCLVLQERFEPGQALALLEAERVTTPHAWPHQLGALEAHPDWARRDLSSLRQVEGFTAFARHPSVTVAAPWSPRAAYGLTETFTIVSSLPADAPRDLAEGYAGEILPGNAVRIVDPDTGRAQPAGTTGEIRVKGPTLMTGYLKTAPEETFDVDGFFATGDAGFVDGRGHLHWVGRTDDLIKTAGAKVSPVEIENELLAHPDLKAAVAVGVPDDTLGQLVVVCAVAHEGRGVDEASVRAFLRGRLASYKIPRRVLFVTDDDLAQTGNAKLVAESARRLAQDRLAAEGA